MNTRYEILKMLKERGDYVSGREIGEKFNMSRSAIWKHIDKLKKEGCIINSVNNKGYLYCGISDIVTPQAIQENLSTEFIGKNIVYCHSVSSTNTYLKDLAEKGSDDGTVVIAEEQLQGKGRRGRSWQLEQGKAIAMSILLKPDFSPQYAPKLTLLMGMAVNKTLRQLCGVNSFIKWPNDVIANGKKLCGILTEMVTEAEYIKYVICGVGINVSNESFPEEIKNMATSVLIETGKACPRREIIQSVLFNFENYYKTYVKTKNLKPLLEEYKKMCINIGKSIKAIYDDKAVYGVGKTINEQGELIMEDSDGKEWILRAGEVSVRGVYQ